MRIFQVFFILLAVSCSSMSFSAAELSIIKVDPDTLDPTMPFVIYNIGPKDLSIASYRQGKPSHFTLSLCQACQEKTYPLSPEARLTLNQQTITQSDLAIIVMKKEFNYISLSINRSTKSIDFLAFDELKKTEF
ncbi:MAG: hypothetical protein ACI9OH_001130 [Oleispira sp.]|jgi:hypothetical protein